VLSWNATPKASARVRHGFLTNEKGNKCVSISWLDPGKQVATRRHERKLLYCAMHKLLNVMRLTKSRHKHKVYDWLSFFSRVLSSPRLITVCNCKRHQINLAGPFRIPSLCRYLTHSKRGNAHAHNRCAALACCPSKPAWCGIVGGSADQQRLQAVRRRVRANACLRRTEWPRNPF